MSISRRTFLHASAAGIAVAVGLAPGRARAAATLPIGAQSYSFRKFDTLGAIAQLKDLGLDQMEFCSVHFPPDFEDPKCQEARAALAEAGVTVPAYGVEGFGTDDAANRKKFEFAKAMGIGVLTADVAPRGFDSVEALCEEFGVKIALHNHGPRARYDKVADTLSAVEGRSALIGACLDTGHCIRSGETPHEVAEALGARLLSMHLKDWIHGGEEQILGEGELDLPALCSVLKKMNFAGPTVMEYENSPENPVPEMKVGLANWQAAWSAA